MDIFLSPHSSTRTGPKRAESGRNARPARLRAKLCFLSSSMAAMILMVVCASARPQITAAAAKVDSSTPAGNTENGRRIFAAQACNKCHGSQAQGVSSREDVAPRIGPTRLSQRLFAHFVRNPTGKMPAYSGNSVSDADLADLYAFLQSLAPPVKADISTANAQQGQRLFTNYGCYECHGSEGQGSTQTGGSRIGPIQIPFPAFITYIRQPTGQMPPYAVKAVSDAELADIYGFLESRPESAPAESIPLLNR
jgi:mono/diheme cytochrome c family protein